MTERKDFGTTDARSLAVDIYAQGIVYSSVCAPKEMPVKEVVAEANRLLGPTGLDHGWMLSRHEAFKTGEPNPCPCDRDPGRLHYLLDC